MKAGWTIILLSLVGCMRMPHQARIHDAHWRISIVKQPAEDVPEDEALTNCANDTIRVQRSLGKSDRALALQHEIMHALGCQGGLTNDQLWNNSGDPHDGCDGHCGIYWGSEELMRFDQENRRLARWIVRHGRKAKPAE